MNRSVKTLVALLVLVGLCCLSLAAFAQTAPDALQITELDGTLVAEGTMLNVTLTNTGDTAIDEFGLALAFFDSDDNRLFGYNLTLEGYTDEVANWYYTPDEPILPGKEFLTEDVFTEYPDAVTVAAAIRYYHVSDGDYVLIPESEWHWELTGYGISAPEEARSYYGTPSDTVYDAISDFNLGYNFYLMDDYNAYYYGLIQGGEWISSVDAGSPAAYAGLQPGDLVLYVDAVRPTENLYAVEYGLYAIMNGQTVDWVIERDGYIYVTRIEKP